MQINKKDLKQLAGHIKKAEEDKKTDPEYENYLRTAEKILKKKRSRK
jgi:hypothetical protein